MAVRDVLQIGNPRLKSKNKPVKNFNSSHVKKITQDLIETMHKNDLIGITGPQIGENVRIFITEPRKTKTRTADQSDELRIYINPKIVYFSKEKNIIYEGCGSVAEGNLFGPVKRSKEIKIEAFNEKSQKFSLLCDGLLARVIQHEYDHLSGIEFTEKIIDYRRLMSREFYIKKIKDSPPQIKASLITVKKYLVI